MNSKYFDIAISSLLLSMGSVFMIKAVQGTNIPLTMFWEFAGPFMYLLYNHYMIEAKTIRERIYVTIANGLGLAIGAGMTLYIFF